MLSLIALPSLLFSSGCYAKVEPWQDIPDPTMTYSVDHYVCTEYLIPNDTSDNTTFTSYPTSGAVKAAPTSYGELVFFADDRGQAYAVSVNGFAVWTYTAEGAVETEIAVDVTGAAAVVYFGSDDGKLYALSATDGTPVSAWPSGSYYDTGTGSRRALSTARQVASPTVINGTRGRELTHTNCYGNAAAGTGIYDCYTIISNYLRFGEGNERSHQQTGSLRDPWYYDGTNWQPFFAASGQNIEFYMMVGASADGVTGWNQDGGVVDIASNSPAATVDASGFIETNQLGSDHQGYGSLKVIQTFTGNAHAPGATITVEREYNIPTAAPRTATITVRVSATGADVRNVRFWVGNRNDLVESEDSPSKLIGDFDASGTFQALSSTIAR